MPGQGVIDNTLTITWNWKTPILFQNLHDWFDIRNGEMVSMSRSEIHNLLWNPNASCLVCHLTSGRYQESTLVNQDSPLPGVSAWNGTKMDIWTADMQLKNMALGSIEPSAPEVQAWCLPGGLISTPAVSVPSTSWKVLLALVSFSTIKATSQRWINLQAKFFWHWRTAALPSAKCKKQTQTNN